MVLGGDSLDLRVMWGLCRSLSRRTCDLSWLRVVRAGMGELVSALAREVFPQR